MAAGNKRIAPHAERLSTADGGQLMRVAVPGSGRDAVVLRPLAGSCFGGVRLATGPWEWTAGTHSSVSDPKRKGDLEWPHVSRRGGGRAELPKLQEGGPWNTSGERNCSHLDSGLTATALLACNQAPVLTGALVWDVVGGRHLAEWKFLGVLEVTRPMFQGQGGCGVLMEVKMPPSDSWLAQSQACTHPACVRPKLHQGTTSRVEPSEHRTYWHLGREANFHCSDDFPGCSHPLAHKKSPFNAIALSEQNLTDSEGQHFHSARGRSDLHRTETHQHGTQTF